MKKLLLLTFFLFWGSIWAQEGSPMCFQVKSAYDFKMTLKVLKKAFKAKDIKVFAEIDHSKAARQVGLSLAPTTVLVVGNPKAGTPLMQAEPVRAIDLPLKVLVYEKDGEVWVGYKCVAEKIDNAMKILIGTVAIAQKKYVPLT